MEIRKNSKRSLWTKTSPRDIFQKIVQKISNFRDKSLKELIVPPKNQESPKDISTLKKFPILETDLQKFQEGLVHSKNFSQF